MHQDCECHKECEVECHKNEDQCPHAESAADAAVKKVFLILEVDVDDPMQVKEFRLGLRVGQRMNKWLERGGMVAVTGLVTGFVYAIWAGIQAAVRGTPG